MSDKLEIGDSAQALYENIKEAARLGHTVESGCAVSINSGALTTSDTLTVASGSIWFGGSSVSVSSQDVQIDAASPDNPRKDVVYLDGTGTAQVAKGTPKDTPDVQDKYGATRFEFVQPEPPDLQGTDAVVLAEVWVPAGATTIQSDDVADRRVDPSVLPSLESNLDAEGNDISNVGEFDATDASVSNSPSASTDVTRKQELDDHTALDNPHATDLENARSEDNTLAGNVDHAGNDILNLGSITGDASVIDVSAILSADSPTDTSHVTTKEYVDSVAQGLEYKESVLSEQNSPPGSPSEGDRYLIDDSPSGDWTGHANELTEYDGSAWTFTQPNEGWGIWIEDADILKNYNGTAWVRFGSTVDHGSLQGLGDDDHTQYLLVDGSRAMSGVLDMDENPVENVTDLDSESIENQDYSEPVGSAADQGSGTYDLDLTSANLFDHMLTEATTFTFSNVSSTPPGNSFTLLITQDGSTQYGITWPGSVEWNGGSAPDDPATGEELEVSFISYDGGMSWKGRKSWGS